METVLEMPKTTALAGWYGSNRKCAAEVGRALAGCTHVTVPFAGGMCELAHISARSIVVSDVHRHIINLAKCVASPFRLRQLLDRVKRLPLHPDVLAEAQRHCLTFETPPGGSDLFGSSPKLPARETVDVDWAVSYFVCCWMSMGGFAGTPKEFTGDMSIRFDAGGGDSAKRYQSAVKSLVIWGRIMERCSFDVADCFDVLKNVKDIAGCGVYTDPPFPGPGEKYTFSFDESQHRRLAKVLGGFAFARVVARFYEHPLIRELYPEPKWRWTFPKGGKKRSNKDADEVLLILNGGAN